MKLNDVIRKYRKENNLTQEEMAARLGVSAPAVNKWESGASMPDITLLAPIARLLHISLDELLSFKENLSEAEVNAKISEIYGMMVKDPIETVFSKINEMVREYPNADYLILNLAMILYTQTLLMKAEEREKYVCWVRETFEKLISESKDEKIVKQATDGVYALYISNEMYDEAEKCLDCYLPDDPERKRKLAMICYGRGKYDDAYKLLEELLVVDYRCLATGLHQIYMVAMKKDDHKKAKEALEKESALAKLFEMGVYHENSGMLDYAVATKDAKKTLEILDILISNTDTLLDFTRSSLYEHVKFNENGSGMFSNMRDTLIKQVYNEDDYQFVRDSKAFEDFKKKWPVTE